VKTTVFLYATDDDQLRWQAADGVATAHGSVADVAADTVARDAELVLVVPAQKVLLRDVAFAPKERRLLRQTVPYSLEEQLIDDVDTQHFALGSIGDNQVPVAIVEKQWLYDWLQQCAQAGLDIKRVLPEQLLLPYREHCWTLRIEPQRWLVRIGAYRGFALEPESAALALQLLLDDAAEVPQQLLVQSTLPLELLRSQLPELLRGSIEVLEAAEPALDKPLIDLLQGIFARTLPWRRWWQQWHLAAIVFAVALVVHVSALGIAHHRLSKQNLSLRQQIEAVYRTVEPRGAVNDPELQLRRKLKTLQGHQGSGVMPLLQQVGAALKKIDGVSVQNLTYSEQQSELRVSVTAAAFKDVEAVRAAIAATGLNAQLVGSNTDGDKTRAQLRIKEQK
jgi:type II secretion system protein L